MRLRKFLNVGLPLAGTIVVFAAILIPAINLSLPLQVVVVLVGLLLIEAGVWNLATPLLPDDRRFLRLREEVDDFIQHVRALNAAAQRHRETGDAGAGEARVEALRRMKASVDRIDRLAGIPDDEAEAEEAEAREALEDRPQPGDRNTGGRAAARPPESRETEVRERPEETP